MTTDSVGGVWQYSLSLAQGLNAHGVNTTLAHLGPPPSPEQRKQAFAVDRLCLIETGLPLDWLANDEAVIEASSHRLTEMAAAHRSDIVHLNSPVLAAFNTFVNPVVGVCHSCVATWWDATCDGDLPTDFQWRATLTARGYAACNILLAPSRAFGTAIANRYGINPSIVVNGIDIVSSGPAAAKEPFVLTAGRLWDQGKNFATVDEAAGLMDTPIYAAGALSQLPANQIACRNAISLGALDRQGLQDWMRRASIFASVAVYEPFGLAVLEAAHAGCALVLSDTDGFRELWGKSAHFVQPYDAKALANTLQTLLHDAERTACMANSARDHAKLYDVETMAKCTMAHYQDLLMHGGLPA